MRRTSCLWLVAASAAALALAGAASSGSDRTTRCSASEVRAFIGGRVRCLAEGKRCRRRLDSAYHRYLFHCHGRRLRLDEELLERRPVRIPMISAGTPCPATTRSRDAASAGLAATYGFRLWGPGPAYPFIGSGGDHAELVFKLATPDSGTEWGGTKAIWGISRRYYGPVLVRGRQLDGPNEMRFENGRPAFTEAKRLNPDRQLRLRGPEPYGNPATSRLRAPGCYAYQVDGRGFSYLIVFEARVAP